MKTRKYKLDGNAALKLNMFVSMDMKKSDKFESVHYDSNRNHDILHSAYGETINIHYRWRNEDECASAELTIHGGLKRKTPPGISELRRILDIEIVPVLCLRNINRE